MRLEINYQLKTGKKKKNPTMNTCSLKHILLKSQWLIEEIRANQKIPWDNRKYITKSVGYSKNSSKREIYSDTGLPHETNKKKPQINNLTLHQREQEKRNLRY